MAYPHYLFNVVKGSYGFSLDITPSGDASDVEGGSAQDVMETYGLLTDLAAFLRARNGVDSVNVHRYTETDTTLVEQ
ncbi:hypothetical protein [Streptomyces sp. NPDC005799]|uniref:hypothetical protein n=1 Tax=Streptomyces sp. NPDC005799 TaxID=3154678 RepID=UPI0033E33BC7